MARQVAEPPAQCRDPAQQMRNGKTAFGYSLSERRGIEAIERLRRRAITEKQARRHDNQTANSRFCPYQNG